MDSQEPMVDPTILARVQQHLEGLKKTPDGVLLYGLIERGLHRYGSKGHIERAFITFLNSLLRKYSQDPNADPATRFKARVIQQRLVLQLAPADSAPVGTEDKLPEPAPVDVAMRSPSVEQQPAPTDVAVPDVSDLPEPIVAAADTTDTFAPTEATLPASHAALSSLNTLGRDLAANVVESVTHDRQFEQLIARNRGLLNRIGHQGIDQGDLKDIEGMLLAGIEQLVDGHQQLGANLQRASEYLKIIQTDRQHLQRQLHQARSHSLIDDVTGLPNRAAMMRSLTAEIGRARRYATPLTVALLDIDNFAEIEAKFGAEASERVLLAYSDHLLSQFRAYDIVSRYGYDAFAIVFPNTDAAGAQRALEKLRAQAATTRVDLQSKGQPLPSFCAVVAPYAGSEKPAALLRRADQALAQRVALGRTPPIQVLLSA